MASGGEVRHHLLNAKPVTRFRRPRAEKSDLHSHDPRLVSKRIAPATHPPIEGRPTSCGLGAFRPRRAEPALHTSCRAIGLSPARRRSFKKAHTGTGTCERAPVAARCRLIPSGSEPSAKALQKETTTGPRLIRRNSRSASIRSSLIPCRSKKSVQTTAAKWRDGKPVWRGSTRTNVGSGELTRLDCAISCQRRDAPSSALSDGSAHVT